MTDVRSTSCVFVSHCMLAQCVMANGLVKRFPGPVKPVIQFCMDRDINIMQMPCPETLCAAGGLGRDPHGKGWYERNGLRETARGIARGQVAYMRQLTDAGIDVLAIIGVEFSPACAVNYLNKGRSIQKDQGIFVEELRAALERDGLDIPFVGICQRWTNKMESDLKDVIEPKLSRRSSRKVPPERRPGDKAAPRRNQAYPGRHAAE